jgi:general secretion pathway protein A
MYTKFYGFKEKPFEVTPDPRFLYLTQNHKEALAHLIYGINGRRGLTVVTGDAGTGKTTLIHTLMRLLSRMNRNDKTRTAYLFNPKLDPTEFLYYICWDLGIKLQEKSKVHYLIKFHGFLLDCYERNEKVVLVIDEAHSLDPALFEEIRLLTNLETPKKKLLQIILMGQPELSELLNRPECLPLKQRISLRYRLNPLNEEETKEYIRTRLRIAGLVNPDIFSRKALDEIYTYSKGIPRTINIICDNALLTGYATDQKTIGDKIIREVVLNLNGQVSESHWGNHWGILKRPILQFFSRFSWRGMKRETNEQDLRSIGKS